MRDTNVHDWRPFIYGGLASIVAELGKISINLLSLLTSNYIKLQIKFICFRYFPFRYNQNSSTNSGTKTR